MKTIESLTEAQKKSILQKALVRDEMQRLRAAKKAEDNDKAGLARVTVLVPKLEVDWIRQEAKRLRTEFIKDASITEKANQEICYEQQPSPSDTNHIDWHWIGSKNQEK